MKSMKLKHNILPNILIFFFSFLEGLAVCGLGLGELGGVDYMFQFQKLKFIDIFNILLRKNKEKKPTSVAPLAVVPVWSPVNDLSFCISF